MRTGIFTLIIASALLTTGCISDDSQKIKEQANSDETFKTSIEWTQAVKDLGTVQEGQKLEIVYEFKNTGSKPLVIKRATPSCGCTVPELPNEPILPGKVGYIKAVFDSQGRQGNNHKTITVEANTEPQELFTLEFNVNVKPGGVAKSNFQ
ncbi:MAG TPA: DUF1573 domain-containing protein [Phnomibacter sp.]|nr:DUF1573 domain-containing protein [Phnomibacter sp.]